MDSTINIIYSVGGFGGQAVISRSEDGTVPRQPTLPTAHALSNWTKTDADTSDGDLSAGHGLSSGSHFTAFWIDDDGNPKHRCGLSATIVGNAVTLEGGAGDDFPDTGSTVLLCQETEVAYSLDGDRMLVLIAHPLDARTLVDYQGSDGSHHLTLDLAAKEGFLWAKNMGLDNPIAGDSITKVMVACAATSGIHKVNLVALIDSTT